jgi:hypothetical protein
MSQDGLMQEVYLEMDRLHGNNMGPEMYEQAVPWYQRQGMFNPGGVGYTDWSVANTTAGTAPPPGASNVPGFQNP